MKMETAKKCEKMKGSTTEPEAKPAS
jgi:hypothetical protein